MLNSISKVEYENSFLVMNFQFDMPFKTALPSLIDAIRLDAHFSDASISLHGLGRWVHPAKSIYPELSLIWSMARLDIFAVNPVASNIWTN